MSIPGLVLLEQRMPCTNGCWISLTTSTAPWQISTAGLTPANLWPSDKHTLILHTGKTTTDKQKRRAGRRHLQDRHPVQVALTGAEIGAIRNFFNSSEEPLNPQQERGGSRLLSRQIQKSSAMTRTMFGRAARVSVVAAGIRTRPGIKTRQCETASRVIGEPLDVTVR